MSNPLHVPALIVGAGPIGLACAISAKRNGLDSLVIDAGALAHSIVLYPVGMTFFTTPERLEIGGHPLTCSGAKATREETLKYYRGVARAEGLNVRSYTRLVEAKRKDDQIVCHVECSRGTEIITCDKLVIATGYFDHPNLLDVPGESLRHVFHWFDEPHLSSGLDVVVIGGKNSAVEAALQCFRAGARVTLVYRGEALKPSIKFWLRPDFENRVAAGEIKARFNAEVENILADTMEIRMSDGTRETIAADRVYALTGYHPDFELLRSIGISLDDSGRPTLNPETLESNVPGVYVAGSAGAGRNTSDVFIENGRWDGDKIFGGTQSRQEAIRHYTEDHRPMGE